MSTENLPWDDSGLPEESPRRPRRPRRRPRKWLVFSGILATLLLVIALVLGGFAWKLGHDFNAGTEKFSDAMPDDAGRPAATDDYNVLLLGSDSRAGTEESKTVTGQRADTIMLLHIPADGGQAYLISIMRDTWVEIPGHGEAKINAALNDGKVPLMVSTIEKLLDTRIDHVASIDFSGFKDLTNSLGGVDVDVPVGFTDHTGATFTQGNMHMDGDQALMFVRERYAFQDGDYQRVRDQRAYLRGLMKEIGSPETMANPVKLDDVVKKFSPYVTVDKDLNASDLVRMATQAGPSGYRNMTMFTLPNQGTGWSDDGQSIVVPDEDAVHQLSEAMKKGTMEDYVKTVKTDG